MKFRDLPAAQFGRYGETIAARMLRNLGAGVIATYGPLLLSQGCQLLVGEALAEIRHA